MYFILLPAYNEEQGIATLLQRIKNVMESAGFDYKVLVVNDGSTDHTLQVVQECRSTIPIEIIDHVVNKGLGQTMLTGLRWAADLLRDGDVLVTMDADNTHDPALIEQMDRKIKTGANLVIASRYEKGGEEVGLSRLRSILSRGASSLLMIFFPIHGAKDYTCGYRAYQGSLIKYAFQVYGSRLVEERGFTCMAEILIKLGKIEAQVSEVPLVLRYDLKTGPSKMKILQTILRYFALIASNIFLRPAAVV